MKLRINITKEILKESMFCNSDINIKPEKALVGQNCAIGKAIYNLFGNRSWVDTYSILIDKKGMDFDKFYSREYLLRNIYMASLSRIALPIEARDFIDQFDNSEPDERLNMEPFSFEINVPDELIEEIGISEVNEILKNSKTLELA